MKQITDKDEMISILTNEKKFRKYQLDIYYHTKSLISAKLRDDPDVALLLVKRSVHGFEHVSKRLRSDKDFAREAINAKASLKFCSDELRNDKELAELSAKHTFDYRLSDIGDELRNDKEYIKYVLTTRRSVLIGSLSMEMRSDDEIALLAVKNDPNNISYLVEEQQKNKELLSIAIYNNENNCYFLQSYQYKELLTKEFVLPLIHDGDSAEVYNYLSEELKRDPDIIKACFKCRGSLIEKAPEEVKNNKEYTLFAISEGHAYLSSISKLFNDDEDVFNCLVEHHIGMYDIAYFSERIKNDKEHMLKLSYTDVFDTLPAHLKADPDIRKAFGLEGELSVTYHWYHGFYTAEERADINYALQNHDYDTFMKIYKRKPKGLPNHCNVTRADDYTLLETIDITIKENFM
ncbi:MAG: hypothetical protein E7178_04705 [Erysipelotrichaceae bacterium]|nr:hypothetical protein [Erysipelotrichaceae bacterium]